MRLPWQRGADERADVGTRSATYLRDERLSEYLDGVLSRPDAVALESSVDHDSEARLALEGMRDVRSHLGELGMVRAPRSFMLTPQNVPRQRGLPRLELYARLATAAAVLALTVSTLQPSSTGTVNERATSSMSESFDAAAPSEARKQGAEQALKANLATVAADGRSAAPTSAGAPGATGAGQTPPPNGALGAVAAPASAPVDAPTTAAAAPTPSDARATSAPAPSLPPPSEQPVPLSNGVDEPPGSSLSTAQFGLIAITSVLAALSLGLWLRRARGF